MAARVKGAAAPPPLPLPHTALPGWRGQAGRREKQTRARVKTRAPSTRRRWVGGGPAGTAPGSEAYTGRRVECCVEVTGMDEAPAGPAGTGKTYLAMAAAISALLKDDVSRIILTRPAIEAGEALGFLPGDLQQKIDPYLRPLYDALHDMLPAAEIAG